MWVELPRPRAARSVPKPTLPAPRGFRAGTGSHIVTNGSLTVTAGASYVPSGSTVTFRKDTITVTGRERDDPSIHIAARVHRIHRRPADIAESSSAPRDDTSVFLEGRRTSCSLRTSLAWVALEICFHITPDAALRR
jgi:hypothetical protein